MKRFAFTMLELVFVIIIVGILAVVAMPSFNSNPLQQAAEQVAGHIRYTQHLAMIDDKFDDSNGTWYKSFWRIRFYQNTGTYYYTIFSDKDQNGNADTGAGKTEVAVDPLTQVRMNASYNNKIMNLTSKYGIKTVASSCDTLNIDIFFDHLGRPYVHSMDVTNPYTALITAPCTISLEHQSDGNATITIQPETGYVSVSYN
jgi:prepilin-type N-terminal cleavage/methylation domain-containing protein